MAPGAPPGSTALAAALVTGASIAGVVEELVVGIGALGTGKTIRQQQQRRAVQRGLGHAVGRIADAGAAGDHHRAGAAATARPRSPP